MPGALARLRQQPEAYAALWCGSAARGEGTAFSDPDFHVLVTGDHRWRSSFVVDGVPVEAFFNPVRKVLAMLDAEESDTTAMFAEGRAVWPHPDLTALMHEAQAKYAAGRTPAPPDEFRRFSLVDEVMDARAALHDPIHVRLVMAALGPLVIRPLYAERGWWEVKPQHWLTDLREKAPEIAAELETVLLVTENPERQRAFEVLARRVTGDFEYRELMGTPQPVT